MRQTVLRSIILMAVVTLAGLMIWWGTAWSAQRQWFALQRQQMATIQKLGEFPPPGWDRAAWKNALVTPHNVWGNVTYHPNYSHISHDEMRSLQAQLDQIVAETTPDNSFNSVDRVFQLLLQRGQKTDFIAGYRDEFREAGMRTH